MVKVGRIDFVNSDPVYYGVEEGVVDSHLSIDLVPGFPRSLNSMLAQGDLDVAPISSVEYARNPGYDLLPGLSVSSESQVGSILVFARRPLDELEGARVALPATSATSTVLLKVLLEERYGVQPEYVTEHPDVGSMLSGSDAALVIGDHALLAARRSDDAGLGGLRGSDDLHVYDLGEEWRDHTGERMVYALWAADGLGEEDLQEVTRVLRESKRAGYDALPEIASRLSERMDLSEDYAVDYLRMLDHDFTPGHRRGLVKYYEAAERIGEIDSVPEVEGTER